jgi:hypothetical protein
VLAVDGDRKVRIVIGAAAAGRILSPDWRAPPAAPAGEMVAARHDTRALPHAAATISSGVAWAFATETAVLNSATVGQSILLFRFITRQQCQCGFSEHHYVDGPQSRPFILTMNPSYCGLTFEKLVIVIATRRDTLILSSVIRVT